MSESKYPVLYEKTPEWIVDLIVRVNREWSVECSSMLGKFDESMSGKDIREEVRQSVRDKFQSIKAREQIDVPPQAQDWIVQSVVDQLFGLGPIEYLVRDAENDAIIINGPREVLVERGGTLYDSGVAFKDEDHILEILGTPSVQPRDWATEKSDTEGTAIHIDLDQLRAKYLA